MNDTTKSKASNRRRYLAGTFLFIGSTFCPEGWVALIVKVYELVVGYHKNSNLVYSGQYFNKAR